MGTVDVKSLATLGFLTVVEHPQYGLFGGYLVLNTSGHPLEFHCTTPVKPNRAQEILYGPTLESFLYGEQIGRTLLNQSDAKPLVICTDQEPTLAAREFVAAPLVLVLPSEAEDEGDESPPPAAPDDTAAEANVCPAKILRLDSAHHGGPRLVTFQLGRNRLALPDGAAAERQQVAERLSTLAESFDLAEPFQRIREAIEEAQQAVR